MRTFIGMKIAWLVQGLDLYHRSNGGGGHAVGGAMHYVISSVTRLMDQQRKELLQEVMDRLPDNKYHRAFECKYGTHENFCERQDCPAASEGRAFNQALDECKAILIKMMGE